MSDRPRAFVPETMETVAQAACREVGLPWKDIRFLRLGQNILFHVPNPPVVVRVARDMSFCPDAAKEVTVSAWLAGHDIPVARVFDVGREQPICVEQHPVTFWHYIPGRTATRDEVGVTGDLLRRLHQLPYPKTLILPAGRPLDRVEDRIRRSHIPDSDKEFLTDLRAQLESQLGDLRFHLPVGVNHGDPHIKNVIVSPDGTSTLIDFEAMNVANHEWDLAKSATETAMGMLPERAYTQFVTAYGHDIRSWADFPTVQLVMQIRMTVWLAQNVSHTSAIASEYRKRISTLRHGFTENWSGF